MIIKQICSVSVTQEEIRKWAINMNSFVKCKFSFEGGTKRKGRYRFTEFFL